MIYEAYNKLDNALMYGVNKTVQAWNWTTGRTKADLASLQIVSGSVLFNTLSCVDNPRSLIFGIPLSTLVIFYMNHEFKQSEKKEVDALEKEARDLSVEKEKRRYQTLGYICNFLGMVKIPRMPLYALSDISLGSSFYTMRAEYLPPRKDCVRRGLEKLAKTLDKITAPAPEPALISYKALQ